ncbi:hypothetical protein BTM25_11940 [Actinomadura rubteroloni]|uniref:DUF1023 domain-containing protein n=1 Tax=Actinomadura rubteroloni TaxID=1926885 RepID=A0A2P4UP08_9ACTN|nr:alpha/beta hydrolase [Actinomadura rubteroloni]POM26786.1 hypothetical protein BTM25_11940 [Actinomadura rubteroloni]
MVDFAQLRDAKLDELDGAWRSWRKLVEQLEQAEDIYRDKFLQGVRTSRWKGPDAEAALRTLVPEQERIRVASGDASSVAGVLNSAQSKFKAAQVKLLNYIGEAQMRYLKVGHDGSIDFPDALPSAYSDWDQLKKIAAGIQQQFVQALKEANAADQQIAAALRGLGPGILDAKNALAELRNDAKTAAQLAGFDPNNLPPKGTKTPQQVAAWWKSLPEEQRHLLMNAYPEKIGWLDGIPSEDRNEANRTRLAARINQLEEKGNNLTRYQHRDLERLRKLNNAISMYESKGQDVYLLGLDSTITTRSEYDKGNGSDGRAIVAFGKPDTAKHTGVYVPGTTENLDNFTGSMNRTFNLNQAASMLTGGPVSTVAWLGYDAPNNVLDHLLPGDAAVPGYAIRGGAQLGSFVDGLRVAQNDVGDAGSQMTLVGHSYGSTVIGEAALQHEGKLPVNDIVVAGSPGMHVAHAGDLGIGARHVWAEKAPGDIVPPAGKLFHGGWTLHGPQVPSDPGFGGNRLDTDGHGHSDYWNDYELTGRPDPDPYRFGTPGVSLEQQAKVVAGLHYDHDPTNDPARVNG